MMRILVVLSLVICCSQGTKPITKIIGGSVAAEGEFPYFVSLQLIKYHFYGGSVISDWVVLTAAHCMLYYAKEKVVVVVGTNNLWYGGDRYKVDDYINHEQYNSTSFANDISLIKVNKQIQFGVKVAKIDLPTMDPPGGLDMVTTGLGFIDNNQRQPLKLQKITVKSLSVTKCQEEHKRIEQKTPITDKQLCTYKDLNKGICQGDSGSALVYNGSVHGITSWNIPCARGKPDVFTRVYKYLEWIHETIEKLQIPS